MNKANSISINLDTRRSVISIGPSATRHSFKQIFTDDEDDNESYFSTRGRHLNCSWLPCCMNEEDAVAFGRFVSIFMVALIAFATFFCVTLILVLVFLLG